MSGEYDESIEPMPVVIDEEPGAFEKADTPPGSIADRLGRFRGWDLAAPRERPRPNAAKMVALLASFLGGIAMPEASEVAQAARLRARERYRELDPGLRPIFPLSSRARPEPPPPPPEDVPTIQAAAAKRARKAAKRARDEARREAGAPRRFEPVVEPHRFGFPTTITVDGRSR